MRGAGSTRVDSKPAAVHFWCSYSATPAVHYAARSQKHTREPKLTAYTHKNIMPSQKHACAVQVQLAQTETAAVHFWCSCSATPAVHYAARSQIHTCEPTLIAYTHNNKMKSQKHACTVQVELAWTPNKQQCTFGAPAAQPPQCTTPRAHRKTRVHQT
jgi:hypothetical protein